jgi:uncharacterized UPF0160 family protein
MKVVTHNGCFHTDEVVACMLLKLLFEIEVYRTRDADTIKKADIVVDVGQIYDHVSKRYDHHQFPDSTGHVETWTNSDIPLSSAGMVWKHYGKDILAKHVSTVDVDALHEKIYRSFFLELDANDNGVNQFKDEIKPNYSVYTTLVGTVSRMNSLTLFNDDVQMQRFLEAMNFSKIMFSVHMQSHVNNHLQYQDDKKKMQMYFSTRENKNIIVVNEDLSNWKSLLKEIDTNEEILFIVYPRDTQWGVQTISKNGFIARKDLAIESVLKEAIGESLVFAHKKRFVVSCTTKEAAIKCAEVSI